MSKVGEALNKVAKAWGKAAAKFLPDVCDVKRKQASGGTVTPQMIHEAVPCGSPEPRGGGKDADAIRAKTTYMIVMPAAINGDTLNTVRSEDLIVVNARGLQPERTFKVQAVEQEQGIKVIVRCTIES